MKNPYGEKAYFSIIRGNSKKYDLEANIKYRY